MAPTLTILAVDGAGQRTDDHLALLLKSAQLKPAERLVLLTADHGAQHPAVQCCAIPRLTSHDYQRLCVERLHEFVETDFMLLVQLDGLIVNPDQWDDAFLDYDYIGAPWEDREERPVPSGYTVGNGGFCLRSKRFLEACAQLKWHSDWQHTGLPERYWGNEDYFLCVLERPTLERAGIRFAPEQVAARFSVQAGDRLGRKSILRRVYGVHGIKLMGRTRRYLEKGGITYPHLQNHPKSFFPLGY